MSQPVIPRVDLDAPSPETDALLVEALSRFGLVHVSGHGLDVELLEAFYRDFQAITARPLAEKSTWGGGEIWYQRGWTPPDTETAVIAGGQPDFKECYFVAPLEPDPVCKAEQPQLCADNVWPADAEDFRERYMALGELLHAVGLELLQACARGLELDAETFVARVEGGAHVTRALRYLPTTVKQLEEGFVWGEEHTDFNMLTLLPGGRFYNPAGLMCSNPDPDAGLYLRTRDNLQVRGTAPEGHITVQVGQQLEILTGGRLLATPHVITAPNAPGHTRCSMAHFVHLHHHRVVSPLPEFHDEDSVAAYAPPVLAGTYAVKTLVDIGLAPREALDRLGYRHYKRLEDQRSGD